LLLISSLSIFPPILLGYGEPEDVYQAPIREDPRYLAAIELMKKKSVKEDTGKKYLAKVAEASSQIGHIPPFNTQEIVVFLKTLHERQVGRTTSDSYRQAISWYHQISGYTDPCGTQIVRLCTAIHRDLPSKGNPPRRPFTKLETDNLIRYGQLKSKAPGDIWDRNGTMVALDISTALRIDDMLNLKHEDLHWQDNPSRLSVFISDGKTDTFSVGKWTTDFLQYSNNMNDGVYRLREFVKSSRESTGFIFRSQGQEGDPISHVTYDTMRRTLISMAKNIGIQDLSQIGWHSCRKTKACLTFLESKEEDSVRTILGHTKKSVVFKKYIGSVMQLSDEASTAQKRLTILSKVLGSKRKTHTRP
jgi:integrase